MNRRTKAQWRELVSQQQESGFNVAEFRRRNGANAKYFSIRKQLVGGAAK